MTLRPLKVSCEDGKQMDGLFYNISRCAIEYIYVPTEDRLMSERLTERGQAETCSDKVEARKSAGETQRGAISHSRVRPQHAEQKHKQAPA